MNVRWMAVLTGFLADFFISQLMLPFANEAFFAMPDISRPSDILMIALLTLSTGIGGYVAGRIAKTDRALNGFLVAIVGILIGQLSGPIPRILIIATVISCLLAALGGYLSRYPAQPQPRSTEQR